MTFDTQCFWVRFLGSLIGIVEGWALNTLEVLY